MRESPITNRTPEVEYGVCAEPTFCIRESGVQGTPTDLFGSLPMQTFRVDDIERLFGVPCNTVRAWIKSVPTSPDPIPTLHLGRAVLIPAQAFRLWLLRQSRAQQLGA